MLGDETTYSLPSLALHINSGHSLMGSGLGEEDWDHGLDSHLGLQPSFVLLIRDSLKNEEQKVQ